MNYDIKNIIANFAQKGVDNTQYNPYAMLNLNENGHTKMLLSFLAYRELLTNIYIREMKKACSMLINRINDYK